MLNLVYLPKGQVELHQIFAGATQSEVLAFLPEKYKMSNNSVKNDQHSKNLGSGR